MAKEPQVHNSFGSVILSVLITLIIVGCAGFIFYTITSQQQPQQAALQEKLAELKLQVEDNKQLNQKISDLEEKITMLAEKPESTETETIETQSWIEEKNNFFKISLMYPPEFTVCHNIDCTDVQEKKVDYWNITGKNKNTEEIRLSIYPRVNALNKLAIEFGQDVFDMNKEAGNVIENSDAIGIFNNQLAYQFDVNTGFIEAGVELKPSQELVLNEEATPTEMSFTTPHRIIYFDYSGLIYRIIHPLNEPVVNKILETVSFKELTEDETNN